MTERYEDAICECGHSRKYHKSYIHPYDGYCDACWPFDGNACVEFRSQEKKEAN